MVEKNIESDGAMREFGAHLAARLKGSEVIQLVGDVGAGKTTLVKGIARGLGVTEDVQSPSFTISRAYDLPTGGQLVHYDFYRLHDPGILADELAETTNRADTITVIEWADIVEGVLPAGHITVSITSPTETHRHVQIEGGDL